MTNKLMISALLFCSSLSFAGGDLGTAPTAAPKKKAVKVIAPASTDSAQRVDETVFGGVGGLGTSGSSTAQPKKLRGTAPIRK